MATQEEEGDSLGPTLLGFNKGSGKKATKLTTKDKEVSRTYGRDTRSRDGLKPNKEDISFANGPDGSPRAHFEEQTSGLDGLIQMLLEEQAVRPTQEQEKKEQKGPSLTHKIKTGPTNQPSTSCPKSQQSTVVIMDGMAKVVSHPDPLKSLRPLPIKRKYWTMIGSRTT